MTRFDDQGVRAIATRLAYKLRDVEPEQRLNMILATFLPLEADQQGELCAIVIETLVEVSDVIREPAPEDVDSWGRLEERITTAFLALVADAGPLPEGYVESDGQVEL